MDEGIELEESSMKKPCLMCGHAVGGGGNVHAKEHCPPSPKPGDNRRSRLAAKRRRARKNDGFVPVRGHAIAGTGKPAASSPNKAGGKNKQMVKKA